MNVDPPKVLLLTLGTRGDVQPFCILGRRLIQQGYRVSILTSTDYRHLTERFGIPRIGPEIGFGDRLRAPDLDGLFHNYFTAGFRGVPALHRLARRIQDDFAEVMVGSAAAIADADLVIYNPFAFFAADIAQACGVPALRVACQPLAPTREHALCLFGSRDWGAFGNRLSYEVLRLVSPLLRRSFRSVRAKTAHGRNLHALVNPLTYGLAHARQIQAYSAAISPPASDSSATGLTTGFWFDPPAPGQALPDEIAAFLAAGPAPVYVGFGSMLWGTRRNTELVLDALARWGGRAILAAGAGGLRPGSALPANVLLPRGVDHELLFPHLAAVVHHGGAGTTGTALRHGLPNVILPVLGDQMYWGRRVAALGAGEDPVPLSRIGAADLAARIARACSEPRFRVAARGAAQQLALDPGVAAVVAEVDRILAERPGAANELDGAQHPARS